MLGRLLPWWLLNHCLLLHGLLNWWRLLYGLLDHRLLGRLLHGRLLNQGLPGRSRLTDRLSWRRLLGLRFSRFSLRYGAMVGSAEALEPALFQVVFVEPLFRAA